MKFKNARTAVAAVAFAALAVCFIAGVATGTWCGFGANDIAVLCPVGALLSMVAAKTLIPRAVLSIVWPSPSCCFWAACSAAGSAP